MKSKKQYDKIVDNINTLMKEEQELVIANMPTFERGIVEAALERESDVWKDLLAIFKMHNISPSVITRIESDNQPSEDAHRPALVCAGVKVSLSYIVSPMDKEHKDGSMPSDVIEKIADIRKQREDLARELER